MCEALLAVEASAHRTVVEALHTLYLQVHVVPLLCSQADHAHMAMHAQALFDEQFKASFSRHFCRRYRQLLQRNVALQLSAQQVPDSSVSSISKISVEMLIIPTLCATLCREEGLMDALLGAATALLESALLPGAAPPVLDPQHLVMKKQRYWTPLSDANHVLEHGDVARMVVAERPDLVEKLAALFALPQHLDPNTRRTDVHVEYEAETWITGYQIMEIMWPLAGFVATAALTPNMPPVAAAEGPVATAVRALLMVPAAHRPAAPVVLDDLRPAAAAAVGVGEGGVPQGMVPTEAQMMGLDGLGRVAGAPRFRYVYVLALRQLHTWMVEAGVLGGPRTLTPNPAAPGAPCWEGGAAVRWTDCGSADVPAFDVGSQPVSYHIPLHRVVAEMAHQALSAGYPPLVPPRCCLAPCSLGPAGRRWRACCPPRCRCGWWRRWWSTPCG
jgi:hypothetical protein